MFEKICNELSSQFCIPKYQMREILLAFKKELIEAIMNGDEFVISGLFAVKQFKTKGYKRLNPFTGTEIEVPARIQTKIVPAAKIKYRPLD